MTAPLPVVGVHGVGNLRPSSTPEQASAQLSAIWSRALAQRFVATLNLHVAYYAGHLTPDGRHGVDDELPPDVRELLDLWLREFDVPATVAHGNATRPVRQALGWIAERRGLAPRLVELFVPTFSVRSPATCAPTTPARRAGTRWPPRSARTARRWCWRIHSAASWPTKPCGATPTWMWIYWSPSVPRWHCRTRVPPTGPGPGRRSRRPATERAPLGEHRRSG